MIENAKKTQTEVQEKLHVVAYFRFQIWIQRGKTKKIHLFSSTCKTNSLYLFCVIDNERWYLHVPKSVETSQDCKVITLWNQKCKPTEPSIAISRTS